MAASPLQPGKVRPTQLDKKRFLHYNYLKFYRASTGREVGASCWNQV